jgi:nucleotide-binding universal stress UspA family protein
VSQRVLRYARTSVACIPAPLEVEASATRNMRCIVAATDFSKLGNGAIPLAYSIVSYAGTVHLVHVVQTAHAGIEPYDIFTPAAPTAAVEAARAQLAQLVPRDAASVAARTQIHVVESHDPAAAISQAAERLGADIICLGTHGRRSVSRALLGSVAQKVLEQTHRPVLLARGPVE